MSTARSARIVKARDNPDSGLSAPHREPPSIRVSRRCFYVSLRYLRKTHAQEKAVLRPHPLLQAYAPIHQVRQVLRQQPQDCPRPERLPHPWHTVIFDLYDHRSEKAGEFLVDLADIEKVKYHKWRFSHGRVVTGQPAKGQQRELSHIILDIPRELDAVTIVDHINGDPRDSRRDNLRICTQAENLMNKKSMSTNTSGFIGVTYDAARNRWAPEIRAGYVRCHLGRYRTKAEAVFARLVAEELVFAEFANEGQKRKKEAFTASLCPETKAHIRAFVTRKLADKNLGHQLCGSSGYAE